MKKRGATAFRFFIWLDHLWEISAEGGLDASSVSLVPNASANAEIAQ